MALKRNLNLFLLVFLLFAIVGCKRTGDIKNGIETDEELYKLENIQLNHIPDSTYTINFSGDNSISFFKSNKNSSTQISVRTFDAPRFDNNDEFILFTENYINNEMRSYEMKSLHFTVIGFKNTTCLKFDGTYRDSTSQGKNKEFLCQDGYLCLVPDNESKIAEIKVAHYATERLIPETVVYDFQSLIETLKFTKD